MKRLLVIMPALNEAESIGGVIREIPEEIEGIDSIEVLVVDDGSTDDTVAVAREAGASVISLHANMGLGVAMQTGIDEAVRRRVGYAVNIDSDGQFDPKDIPKVLAPLLAGQADFASASRFKDKSLIPAMPMVKRWGNWGMSKIVSWICGQSFADVSCGFRAYTRETMLQLVLSGDFTYTQESFILLAQRNRRIVEVPLTVRGVREKGKSRSLVSHRTCSATRIARPASFIVASAISHRHRCSTPRRPAWVSSLPASPPSSFGTESPPGSSRRTSGPASFRRFSMAWRS
jgi:glycosyltransferase involved in cell wall biosynthesis